MRATSEHLERFRVRTGPTASAPDYGMNGAFFIPGPPPFRSTLRVIASDGAGWEHVSVSAQKRIPTWSEMDWIKGLFWEDEECVMQLHPPRSRWVDNCGTCLHLWRPLRAEIPQPPMILVGIPGLEEQRSSR